MFNYDKYIRKDKFPHIWCSGCGNGIILKSSIRAIDKIGWDKNDVMTISGIGCSSRATGYLDFDSLHTLHGRALAFATGIKMAKPKMNVVVFTGDGDAGAIGGNHLIHAARRNIDITAVIFNNNIYGMTGGQYSPTTPQEFVATTAPYGHIENSFNFMELAIGAGASFAARTTVTNPKQVENFIHKGLENKGFSVIEVVSNCHVQFGRRNEMKSPIQMFDWIKERIIPMSKAEDMSEDELENKVITGVFKNIEKPEYVEEYDKNIMAKAEGE
ncbi:MAG: 2-oxoacid:ferredoxin oxidoreductase subunit beta [Candidatus Mcinerneyibacterium aminivorans]|uniref:2-oxoacid:ferredoxin oxidoreductase subunit beta n=1 Tax=Candidatus Mcinerneyibacterium aminivorans TaxID=2703815 RepID=A0A5D0MKU9_9BACT|nr:MAG: 2-oxoacid:ferredoxin oxidoreductase subunit beta [Candidatus Mcinerneyibacterium aminivorans]